MSCENPPSYGVQFSSRFACSERHSHSEKGCTCGVGERGYNCRKKFCNLFLGKMFSRVSSSHTRGAGMSTIQEMGRRPERFSCAPNPRVWLDLSRRGVGLFLVTLQNGETARQEHMFFVQSICSFFCKLFYWFDKIRCGCHSNRINTILEARSTSTVFVCAT